MIVYVCHTGDEGPILSTTRLKKADSITACVRLYAPTVKFDGPHATRDAAWYWLKRNKKVSCRKAELNIKRNG